MEKSLAVKPMSRRRSQIVLAMAMALSTGCDLSPTGPRVTLPAGLEVHDVALGTGPVAIPGEWVTVHYECWLTDSTKIDSSLDRGQPFVFQLGDGGVIKGWELGIPGMQAGGRRWLTIPPELAYGALGTPGGPVPPNATLLFDITMVKVSDRAP